MVDTGFKKDIIKEGSGPTCPPGSTVLAHYTGKFLDKKVFDSSYERGEPLQFRVGKGQVIKCWDQGITMMKKGEKALLTCPHEMAYGPRGIPGSIPPKATLIFEVELLNFK